MPEMLTVIQAAIPGIGRTMAPDTRAHGANESLHLEMFERACLAEALVLHRLGARPTAPRRDQRADFEL
jgi:hypothetical protein